MSKSRQRTLTAAPVSAHNSQQGFTLTEVLVALAILAAAATVFLVGMTTASRSVMVSQRNVSAESLAKSELEYVKSSPYYSTNTTWTYQLPSGYPPWGDTTHTLPTEYNGYTVNVSGERALVPGQEDYDYGMQKITIVVTRQAEEPPFVLEGYKAK